MLLPDPGGADMMLTARLCELANNSAFEIHCILVFEEAEYLQQGDYTRR